ncbi:Lrp/AsnC family transcriptional regulator [Streptomyces sp. NPDC048650]|uniref:Lrp/AsnC family transcriptional regulator n=1 Tax=unclassified Streptomyces TaxID=2593676 RepID=UPI003719FE46
MVRELQRDARQTNRELARMLNIAPSTCLERVRALRARGVITGYRAMVDRRALNRPVQALLSIRIRPLDRELIERFKAFLISLPEVLNIYVVAGGDDFLVHVAVPDVDRLHGLLMDEVLKRREVVDCRSSVIYQHVANDIIGPLPPNGRNGPNGA